MRRALLLLVCLLLSLQGLLGAGMALAQTSPAQPAHSISSCHETSAAATHTTPPDHASSTHSLCAACSLCYSAPWLGALALALALPQPAPRSARPPHQGPAWKSALLAPALKPPIA